MGPDVSLRERSQCCRWVHFRLGWNDFETLGDTRSVAISQCELVYLQQIIWQGQNVYVNNPLSTVKNLNVDPSDSFFSFWVPRASGSKSRCFRGTFCSSSSGSQGSRPVGAEVGFSWRFLAALAVVALFVGRRPRCVLCVERLSLSG